MSTIKPNRIVAGDCVEILSALDEPIADLIFADPPFNIGYKYDVYEDRKAYHDYYAWTKRWVEACAQKALKPRGSFWIAIGDDYAAEVRMIAREAGLHLRNWVIWHYTFGQNTKKKFARSHTHLFYFVKDPRDFTFNDKAVRIPSARQTTYADKRANPIGKLPDDVWTEFPRVCGTFQERQEWHPCQMPESILARIIRTCTAIGDVVVDPFAGSGTSLAVAKKSGRRFVGIELSVDYVTQIRRRLRGIRAVGHIEGERARWPHEHVRELQALYAETRVPTDKLRNVPDLLPSFVQHLNWRVGAMYAYQPQEVWLQLERLRKAGKLPKVRAHAEEPTKGPISELPTLFEK